MMVIKMAMTPSEKASKRDFFIGAFFVYPNGSFREL